MPPDDAALVEARAELAACVLNSSFWGSVVGAGAAVPLCLARKSYAPLVAGIAGGTVLDMAVGLYKCQAANAAATAAADAARHREGGG